MVAFAFVAYGPSLGWRWGSASMGFFVLLRFIFPSLNEMYSLVLASKLPLCGCCFATAVTDGKW